ncbi:MAG: hypothetical protein HOP04_09925 [Methylophilaceae bacterium]|nr:hypothetical protein [Methylophilaceae bacterium]
MDQIKPNMFTQLHIDVARNSTDDFNLFHDSRKWQKIRDNPFNGAITLGFQLESMIEGKIAEFRNWRNEEPLISQYGLNFSNYQFNFADAIKPDQLLEVEIKASQFKAEPLPTLSNRVLVKSNNKLALIGYKRETTEPLYLGNADLSWVGELKYQADRSFLDRGYFLKRKFMMTSNAKNFLCGSLRDQTLYFDEVEDKVIFPEIFPCALLSSALLEKALKKGHDFERNPMVYTAHKICVDKCYLKQLKSNDALHILIRTAENCAEHDFGELNATSLEFECYGLFGDDNRILFRALISLAPLAFVIKAIGAENSAAV